MTTDVILLAGSALAILGYENSKNSIYNVLGWANNGGSVDVITDKRGSASIGNIDPNMCGLGKIALEVTEIFENAVRTIVKNDGIVRENRPMHLPNAMIDIPTIKQQD